MDKSVESPRVDISAYYDRKKHTTSEPRGTSPPLVPEPSLVSFQGTYRQIVFSTSGPIVRDHIEAILLAIVHEILDVIISGMTGDSWHNTANTTHISSVNILTYTLLNVPRGCSVPDDALSALRMLQPVDCKMASMAILQQLSATHMVHTVRIQDWTSETEL